MSLFKPLLTLLVVFIPTLSYSQNVKTFIPERAYEHLPTLKAEVERILPGFDYPHYFAALSEHESCISLKHSRCWSPTSRLKTSREEGAGIPQLTRAYTADGKLRFDTLSDLRRQYITELKDLSWANVYQRPDLQLRAMVLLSKQNYDKLYEIKDPWERLAMSDSAYNGGLGNVNKGRRICGMTAGCDPAKWFDNVENIVVRSTKVLYGNRSAQDINTHHVRDVLYTRMPKYESYFKTPSEDKTEDSSTKHTEAPVS